MASKKFWSTNNQHFALVNAHQDINSAQRNCCKNLNILPVNMNDLGSKYTRLYFLSIKLKRTNFNIFLYNNKIITHNYNGTYVIQLP